MSVFAPTLLTLETKCDLATNLVKEISRHWAMENNIFIEFYSFKKQAFIKGWLIKIIKSDVFGDVQLCSG